MTTGPTDKTPTSDSWTDFLPETLLKPDELRKARRQFLALERLSRVRPDLKADRNEAKRRSIDEQLVRLAEAVLKREMGLELYMVLDVHTERRDRRIQALHLGLTQIADERLAWRITGRLLKKDGTLGTVRDYLNIAGEACVSRRKLDGTWVRLTRRGGPG